MAKYKKGAIVPDGNTQFQFKAGDRNFHSTSYDWLVVAGDAPKFKGDFDAHHTRASAGCVRAGGLRSCRSSSGCSPVDCRR